MGTLFQKKTLQIKEKFQPLSLEEKFREIIALGRGLSPYPEIFKTKENLVPGCQSLLYLHCAQEKDRLVFSAHSDALISKGLAALLIELYSQEIPETILTCPPKILEELGITKSLSPSRSNGLAQIYRRMQGHAIKALQAKKP